MTFESRQVASIREAIIRNGQEHLLKPENQHELKEYLGKLYDMNPSRFRSTTLGSSSIFSQYGNKGELSEDLMGKLEDLLDDLDGSDKRKLAGILSEIKSDKPRSLLDRLRDKLDSWRNSAFSGFSGSSFSGFSFSWLNRDKDDSALSALKTSGGDYSVSLIGSSSFF